MTGVVATGDGVAEAAVEIVDLDVVALRQEAVVEFKALLLRQLPVRALLAEATGDATQTQHVRESVSVEEAARRTGRVVHCRDGNVVRRRLLPVQRVT